MFIASNTKHPAAKFMNPHLWTVMLNGWQVNAIAADDERGFVDIVENCDVFQIAPYTCRCGGEDQCENCCAAQASYEEWLTEGHVPFIVHRLWGNVEISFAHEGARIAAEQISRTWLNGDFDALT